MKRGRLWAVRQAGAIHNRPESARVLNHQTKRRASARIKAGNGAPSELSPAQEGENQPRKMSGGRGAALGVSGGASRPIHVPPRARRLPELLLLCDSSRPTDGPSGCFQTPPNRRDDRTLAFRSCQQLIAAITLTLTVTVGGVKTDIWSPRTLGLMEAWDEERCFPSALFPPNGVQTAIC